VDTGGGADEADPKGSAAVDATVVGGAGDADAPAEALHRPR